MAIAEIILKIIGQDSTSGAVGSAKSQLDGLDGAAGRASTSTGGLGSKLSGVGAIAGGFVVGSALTNLPGLLMEGAKGAAEDEASLGRLTQAIDNTGASSADYGDRIDDLISKGEDLAFTDGETTSALAMLVNMTGDADTAMADLATAQDLARGAGISLESAAKLIGKTSDENTASLRKLGIELEDGATRTDALAAIQAQFGDQAQQYASSAAGEYAKFGNQLGELQETVGSALIPVFMALAPVILGVVQAAMPAIEALAGALALIIESLPSEVILGALVVFIAGALVPGMIAWTVATYAQVSALIAQAAAMLAAYAPIILLIAGIGLLIAAGYLLVTHFDEIKAAVVSAFETMRDLIIGAIQAVIGWITANWPLLLAILTGPIGLAVLAIIEYWDEITGVFDAAVSAVTGLLSSVWATVEGLLGDAVAAGQALVESALSAIEDAFNAAVDFVTGLLSSAWSTVETLVSVPVDLAKAWVQLHLDAIRLIFDTTVSTVTGILTGTWSLVQSYLVDPVSAAAAAILGFLNTTVGYFTELPGRILTALGNTAALLFDSGQRIVEGLRDGAASMVGSLLSFIGDIPGRILDGLGNIGSLLYNAGRSLIQSLIDGINSLIGSIPSIGDLVPDLPFGLGSGSSTRGGGIADKRPTPGTQPRPIPGATPADIVDSIDAFHVSLVLRDLGHQQAIQEALVLHAAALVSAQQSSMASAAATIGSAVTAAQTAQASLDGALHGSLILRDLGHQMAIVGALDRGFGMVERPLRAIEVLLRQTSGLPGTGPRPINDGTQPRVAVYLDGKPIQQNVNRRNAIEWRLQGVL